MLTPSDPERIAGIVLAAGLSSRMGTQKMLLDIEGEPLVRRTCRRALAAGLDPLVVVVGHEAERVSRAIDGLDCQVTYNSEFAAPMSGSLRRGLSAVPPTIDAAVVLLADMYEVSESMLSSLVTVARHATAPLVVSRYASVLAPPMLFRRCLFAELTALDGENPGKAVALAHAGEAVFLDWPKEALRDLDTPDDLKSTLNQ